MKNIIVSGCSYSNGYPYFLKESYNLNVKSLSFSGQSNDSIIRKIYDYITTEKVTDSLFICQFTWTHRIGGYHNSVDAWLDYQPNFINLIPKYNELSDKFEMNYKSDNVKAFSESINEKILTNSDEYLELQNMYGSYLKLVYNEEAAFLDLLYNTDLIESFIQKTNNQILFIYWPLIQNDNQCKELKNRNFFNINGEYSMLNWSTKTKKLTGQDSHLSYYGSMQFAEILYNHITNDNLYINKTDYLL